MPLLSNITAAAPVLVLPYVPLLLCCVTLQHNLLQELPLCGQCAGTQLRLHMRAEQAVVRLLQQLLEGRQMRLPPAAACMPAHEVEPAGPQQLLLPKCLELRPHDQLWCNTGVWTAGKLVLVFTERFLSDRHHLPTGLRAAAAGLLLLRPCLLLLLRLWLQRRWCSLLLLRA